MGVMVTAFKSTDGGVFKGGLHGNHASKGVDSFVTKPPIPKPHSCDVVTQKGAQFTSRHSGSDGTTLSQTIGAGVTSKYLENGLRYSGAAAGNTGGRSTPVGTMRTRARRAHPMWRMLYVMFLLSAVLTLGFCLYRASGNADAPPVRSFWKAVQNPEAVLVLVADGLKAAWVAVFSLKVWENLVGMLPTSAVAWDHWLWLRAVHIAPVLQQLMDICIAIFLVQSLDKALLCFGCGWVKLKGFKYSILKKSGGQYAPCTPKNRFIPSPDSVLNGHADDVESFPSEDNSEDCSEGSESDYPGRGQGLLLRGDDVEVARDLSTGVCYRPSVLVQIPMCNERECYKQSIAAACNLDWPSERFLIQVLDDSDEVDVQVLIREEVNLWHASGANILYLHRTKRTGHKAGNLKYGMSADYVKDYDFIIIFDADFMPERDYIQRTVPFFYGRPELALVQARWAFFNRDQNLLTRFQSIAMSYHFEVEQQVMSYYSRFFGFNGTAGVWRRTALEEAGGWDSRTTVEDMDMAVRAHLRGWEFIFLNDVRVLCELPSTYISYCKQQHRWHAGPMQLFKLMWKPILLAKKFAVWKKVNLIVFFFLLRKLVLPFVAFVLFCILLPASIFVPEAVAPNWAIFHVPLFLSFLHVAPADWSLWPLMYPFLIFENIMSLTKFKAVVDGLFGSMKAMEWVVTRKIGSANDITLEALLKGTQFEKMGKKVSELAHNNLEKVGKKVAELAHNPQFERMGKKVTEMAQTNLANAQSALPPAMSARLWSVFGKSRSTPNKIPKQMSPSSEHVVDLPVAPAPPKRTTRTIHLRELTLSIYLLGAATYSIFLLDGRHFFFLFFQGLGLFLAGFDILGDLGN